MRLFQTSASTIRGAGFTLVELIVIIALLGILSAVAISRFGNVQTFQDLQLKDQLISVARIAQQTALNRYGQPVRLSVSHAGDWLLAVEVEAPGGSGNWQAVKQLAVKAGNASLSGPPTLDYDNLGNLSGVTVNQQYQVSGKLVCISLAGYAYLAEDSDDCLTN